MTLKFLLFAALLGGAVAQIYVPGLGYYWIPEKTEFRWDEAMTKCWYDGGHLAVINSQAEAEAIADLMKRSKINGFAFIGFSDIIEEGYYITVTDELLKSTGYTSWANGFPNGGRTTNCGAINTKGELADVSCTQFLPLVCEKETWTEYELVPGLGYYHLYTNWSTWGEALEACHKEGSNLLVLNSEVEAIAVVNLLFKDGYVKLAHVGLHDQYREAFYTSVHGEEIGDTGYNRWVLGEPHKDSQLNYVAMDNQGLYHMINDTLHLPYICEHKLANAFNPPTRRANKKLH